MDEKTLDEPDVEDASDPSRAPALRPSRRIHSHRSSSAIQKVSRRLVLAVALSVSLLVLLIVILFSVVSISGLYREKEALQNELANARLDLSQTGPELERMRKIVSDMTKGRLPYLSDLVPDKVLNINNIPYIKNIIFTVLNKNGTKSYEYKMVVENSTTKVIHPTARMLVFDRYGVQIGSAEIAGRAEIAPGESRSQSSVIDLFIDEEPLYFYVSTLDADKPIGLIW